MVKLGIIMILIAFGAGAVGFSSFARGNQSFIAAEKAKKDLESIRCVYAIKEVRGGSRITRDALAERIIRRKDVPPGAVVQLNKVVNRRAEYSIPKDKFVFFPLSEPLAQGKIAVVHLD